MWPFKRRKVNIYVPPPRSPAAPAALAALGEVPGPSPWYLDNTAIQSAAGRLRWQSAGDGPSFAGKSVLVNTGGGAVAMSDFHCYVSPVRKRQLLVWYVEERADGADVRLRLFDVDALRPIGDLPTIAAQLGPAARFHAVAGELDTSAVSTTLADGLHRIAIPTVLQDLGELLILAHSTADGRRQKHCDQRHLRLWVLDTASGTLDITPQDWFNQGPYDFGYQWVTRMARLPGSDDIVGEGIRLGVFRLDPTRRHVAEWLVADTFYHPEREPSTFVAPEA